MHHLQTSHYAFLANRCNECPSATLDTIIQDSGRVEVPKVLLYSQVCGLYAPAQEEYRRAVRASAKGMNGHLDLVSFVGLLLGVRRV